MSMFLSILISEEAFAKIDQLLVLIQEQRDTLWNLMTKKQSYALMVPNPFCKIVSQIHSIKKEVIDIHSDFEKLSFRSLQWSSM